jgi:hypothetical protein
LYAQWGRSSSSERDPTCLPCKGETIRGYSGVDLVILDEASRIPDDRVRAGDLVAHEFNFRTHPAHQRAALEALYQEVGFARSLLAYELPDGRLKLIDGHLRRDVDPDMEVSSTSPTRRPACCS